MDPDNFTCTSLVQSFMNDDSQTWQDDIVTTGGKVVNIDCHLGC